MCVWVDGCFLVLDVGWYVVVGWKGGYGGVVAGGWLYDVERVVVWVRGGAVALGGGCGVW